MMIKNLGVSHHEAPIEIRERLTYSQSAQAATLARYGCGHETAGGIRELIVLSTCNRVELYAASSEDCEEQLIRLLEESSEVSRAEFLPFLVFRSDLEAVRHLCRVAAGLDSQLLGEPQIMNQVGDALSASYTSGACGPLLNSAFNTALRSGKRARTESGISRNPATIGSVAVRFARELVPDLHNAHVAILGAGEMAELAGNALVAQGAGRVTVLGRNAAQAEVIARKLKGVALPFERIDDVLADADIVIAATAAPHVIIEQEHVRAAMAQRPLRKLLFIDIAVPRDVDPCVSVVPNVTRYDVDDLQARLDAGLLERQRQVPQVEAIIEQELSAFAGWVRAQDVTPTIADLRRSAEAIAEQEIARLIRDLPHLTPADHERIRYLGKAILNKWLHHPSVRLRHEGQNGQGAQLASVLRDLFQLDA